jgi:hypothetical protein
MLGNSVAEVRQSMKKRKHGTLRERAAGWTCNQFAITNHEGNTATLLRKLADCIEELEPIDILGITYSRDSGPTEPEITATVYFSFLEKAEEGGVDGRRAKLRRSATPLTVVSGERKKP